MCDMYDTCTECLACAYGAVHSTLNSATYVLPISDVRISRFIILYTIYVVRSIYTYTIVGSHGVYMYMWCVHCVLLDERISSEKEAIKAAGCVWSGC